VWRQNCRKGANFEILTFVTSSVESLVHWLYISVDAYNHNHHHQLREIYPPSQSCDYASKDTSFDGDGNSFEVQTSRRARLTALHVYTCKCRKFCYLMNASNATSHNFTFDLLQSVPYFTVSLASQMFYKVCTSQEFLWTTEILLSEHLDKHSLIMWFEQMLWRTWDLGSIRVSYRGKKSLMSATHSLS
jgi:hypothetical protein